MRLKSLSLAIPFLAACATADGGPVDNGGAERGAIGKADASGSCESPEGEPLCGGPGDGWCYCDAACLDWGDCCPDAKDVCDLGEPEPEGEPCGGFGGFVCDDPDQFCMYDQDAFCGAADQMGECADTPEFCPEIFFPVCGCDGEDYGNHCFAHGAGTSVAHEGPCETDECEPVLCELFCEDGFATDEDGCEVCSCAEPPPSECKVAGCSSELCVPPDGPDFSICIFEDWYVCLDLTTCGLNGPEGGCGWDMNPEYVECITSFGQ